MAGTGDPNIDAILAQIGTGGGAAKNTGPSAASALGGNYLNGGKAPVVFWGVSPGTSRGAHNADSLDRGASELGITPGGAKEVGLQEAVADWYKWSDAERAGFAKRLYGLGLISDPNDLYGQNGAFAGWQNAVQTASNFYMAAGRKVTPWQAVDLMANTAGGPQSKTQTNTSRSFNIPTVEDAHVATKQIFQALMGRDPDKNELDRYGSMMSAYAQKHPTVTKQTQTTDIHGNTTSSSTSSGGYSAAGVTDMLSDRAKADPEYGSYQAATTYFNALIGAMGGLGGGNG
jgi:hypothetical protein